MFKFICFILATINIQANTISSDNIKREIRQSIRELNQVSADGNQEKFSYYYTHDLVFNMPFSPQIQGRKAFQKRLEFLEYLGFKKLVIEPGSIEVLSPTKAFQTGRYSIILRPYLKIPGRYMCLWTKSPDGEWLVSRETITMDKILPDFFRRLSRLPYF